MIHFLITFKRREMMATKIMLADFLYDNDKGPSYFLAPLNIAYIASYAQKMHGDQFEFKLYRNVNKFIEDFNKEKPDIVGFAQYIWNHDLTQNVMKWVRHEHPDVLAIAGGPMVGSTEDSAQVFMQMNPRIDICITVYGEYGFSEILQRYLDCNGDKEKMKKDVIQGCSFESNGSYVQSIVDQLTVKPNDIPSPYLTGLLDPFLEEGYSPIIQCMRGCPYTCSFCFASKLNIGQFDKERIIAELDHIYKRTTSSALAVTDDNFGLYTRDLDIAKHIRSIYDQFGYPNKLLLYYSKKPTETVFEISKIMGELAPFFISYQSRNPETLKAIKRYNLVDENTRKISKMCKENDIHVTSEMIFGLPHETKETFMKGVEELYQLDVDTVAIYHCKFFNGVDLSTKCSMKEFKIKTKHRLYEDNFQIFDTKTPYGDIIGCETDEVPVQCESYSYQDFLDIRMLGFWIELCLAKRMYYEVLRHLESHGISPFRLIYDIINGVVEMSPKIKAFFKEVQAAYEEELFDTFDELKEDLEKKLEETSKFKSKKVNLYYCYKIIYTELKNEFDAFVQKAATQIAKNNLSQEQYEKFMQPLDELFKYHNKLVVKLDDFEKGVDQKDDSSVDVELSGQEFNQGSDNAQRYLMEGTKAAREQNELSGGTAVLSKEQALSKYREQDAFVYDILSWTKDRFTKPLWEYKNDNKIKVQFVSRNPKQFEVFVRKVKDDTKAFTWHNYIYSNNVKARVSTVKE